MKRIGPDRETWELIRSFTGAGRYVVAVVRCDRLNHVRNIAMTTYEGWPEA